MKIFLVYLVLPEHLQALVYLFVGVFTYYKYIVPK